MSFSVQTPTYSGPFDLLLRLVYQQKVAIDTISVSNVIDQYLEEIKHLKQLDLEVASDFVLVASTLLMIKASSVAPLDTSESNQSQEIDSEEFDDLTPQQAQDLLVTRLLAYKQFREVARMLQARSEQHARMFAARVLPLPDQLNYMPNFLEGITLRTLAVICADIDSRHQEFLLEASHIAKKRRPIAVSIAKLDQLTREKPCVQFAQVVGKDPTPVVVVENFLAMLELVHIGFVEVQQAQTFGSIVLQRVQGTQTTTFDTSRYAGEN